MQRYIQQLNDWRTDIVNGEEVDTEAIEGLMQAACERVPTSAIEEVEALARAVESLELLIRDRYEEVGEELRRLGQGRQALKVYNHLRGYAEGQRLYRRA